jgi:hypothetical protein
LKPAGFYSLEGNKGYELKKIRSPWLRSSMRFRSLHCDGADERACWFDGRDGNARRSDVAFDGDARRFHAKFDGTDANAARSDDEFTIGLPTLWRPKFQSK